MAQTGYTPISIYYSSTATNVPTAGNLVAGELAINTADGKLFYKDSAGVVQVIGTKGGVGSSTTTQVLYNSSGLVVGSANMTFSGTALTLANDASISGLTVGKGAGSNTANSTALGLTALGANTTGYQNDAIGGKALFSNTTGIGNTAVGFASLYTNTTGGNNAGFGNSALYANSTGSYNVAVGETALQANTTASNNTAVGYQAGYSNTTGTRNSFFGNAAGYSNTTSNGLTAIGFNAGNLATGGQSLYVGTYTGKSVTTGIGNCIIGNQAGYSLTTGSKNTFVGSSDDTTNYSAGYFVTTGSNNTILGNYSGNQGGLDIRTASNYIVFSDGDGNPRQIIDNNGDAQIGTSAGAAYNARLTVYAKDTGSNGIFVKTLGAGQQCINFRNADTTGTRYFAYFEVGTGTNVGAITSTGSTTVYGTSSDYRLKENVVPMVGALDIVAKLKPVTYTWKNTGIEDNGFIAHELQEVLPNAVTGEKDAVNEDGSIDPQGIDTSFLVATLTAAIQELKAEFDAYKATHP